MLKTLHMAYEFVLDASDKEIARTIGESNPLPRLSYKEQANLGSLLAEYYQIKG